MQQPLKILLLEDSRSDAEMIQRLLKKELPQSEFFVAMDKQSYQQGIDQFKPHVILSDHALPQFDSPQALAIAKHALPNVPFIMVTGTASEEFAASIIIQGADDYILKDRMARLPAAINIALKQKKTEAEKKEVFKSLQESEEKYRTILERVSDGFVALDKNWCYRYVNEKAGKILNQKPASLFGKHCWSGMPEGIAHSFRPAFEEAYKAQHYIHTEEYFAPFHLWIETHIYPSPEGLSIFLRDITLRKQSEEKLKISEEKYRTTFYKNPLPSWIFDIATLRFLDINEAAIKHYGYSRNEFLSMTIKDIRPKEELARLASDLKKINKIKSSRISTWQHQKKNGELIIVETIAHSIQYNHTLARLVVVKDITQKIKDQEELKQSEERLKEAQAVSHLGNWEIDFTNNTYFWSDETYKILGLRKGKVNPSMELFLSRIHPNERFAANTFINEAFDHCADSKIIFRFLRSNNETGYASAEWHFELDKDKKPLRLFGIIQDVTAIKKAEEKLTNLEKRITEQKIEEQKKIARAIIHGQEKERNYIGQELHDNINQLLATVKMYLGGGMQKNSAFKEMISYPMEVLEMSMEEIRLLCHKLVTPAKNIDLETMISDLEDRLEIVSPVKINSVVEIKGRKIPDELKLNIYRILQEQFNNIYKYAAAKNVSLSIKMTKSDIVMITKDDGKGFDITRKRKGVGITNMLNRVQTFNGKMEIKSEPGKGCRTEIRIPI